MMLIANSTMTAMMTMERSTVNRTGKERTTMVMKENTLKKND